MLYTLLGVLGILGVLSVVLLGVIMAKLADVKTAVTALTEAVAALEARASSQVAATEAELDGVVADVGGLTTRVAAILPPTP